jgi:N-acyl homoserine lactone hydrolase
MSLKIEAIHLGTLVALPKSSIMYMRGHMETIDCAILMFVITGGDHPVIVDTGTSTPEMTKHRHGFTLRRPPEQEPLAALSTAGIDPGDVKTVINTHLHWDHCANNDLFPNAKILVQEDELRYAIDPLPTHHWSYERRPGLQPCWFSGIDRMQTVRGDVEILPGLHLVHLPGHSPGSQGVVVETDDGRYLIAGDCVSHYGNWQGDERLDHIPTGGLTSMHDFFASFAKIEELNCTVIPSHDPRVLDQRVFG